MVYSNCDITWRDRKSYDQISVRSNICQWYSLFYKNYSSVCLSNKFRWIYRFSFSDQLLYPFKVLDRVNMFDVDVVYDGIGFTAQAIATRLAISKALCSFISSKEVEHLRLGLCQFTCLFSLAFFSSSFLFEFSWSFDWRWPT